MKEKRYEKKIVRKLRKFFNYKNNAAVKNINVKNTNIKSLLFVLTFYNKVNINRYAYFEIFNYIKAYYKVSFFVFFKYDVG